MNQNESKKAVTLLAFETRLLFNHSVANLLDLPILIMCLDQQTAGLEWRRARGTTSYSKRWCSSGLIQSLINQKNLRPRRSCPGIVVKQQMILFNCYSFSWGGKEFSNRADRRKVHGTLVNNKFCISAPNVLGPTWAPHAHAKPTCAQTCPLVGPCWTPVGLRSRPSWRRLARFGAS